MDYLTRLYSQANEGSDKTLPSLIESPRSHFQKADEILFKFENLVGMVNPRHDDMDTGVTQNKQGDQQSPRNGLFVQVEGDVCQSNDNVSNIHALQQSSHQHVFANQVPDSSIKKLVNQKVRRDVVNKTIFRIIRRFFHSVLVKLIPDYKNQKKDNLMNMLVSLSEYLFPQESESIEIAQVLSALMFRREILLSKPEPELKAKLQVFLDVQSKYTHKLIAQAISNKYFGVIFGYFLENGISFFESDDNVTSHPSQYQEELAKIKAQFLNTF